MDAIFISSNKFKVSGDNVNDFIKDRRVKLNCSVDGVFYASIVSSELNGEYTEVVIDELVLTSNLIDVLYSVVKPGEQGNLSLHNHSDEEGQGGEINIPEFFYDLTDTPENYSDGKHLISTASGIEFDDNSYYSETEIDSKLTNISGSLQSEIDNKPESFIDLTDTPENYSVEDDRLSFIIDHTKVDEDLTNFPVLINLSSNSGQTNFDATDVFDILGSYDNRKKLYFEVDDFKCVAEIESWDQENKKAAIWVRVPIISSTEDTKITLKYNSELFDYDKRTLIANEDFIGDDGSYPNINKWISGWGTGASVTINNNKLRLYTPDSDASAYTRANAWQIVGDFDIQVDFDLVNGPSQNYWEAGLRVEIPNGHYFIVQRTYNGTQQYRYGSNDGSWHQIGTSGLKDDSSGKLRITRTGDTFTAYYWGGSDWVNMGSDTIYVQSTLPVEVSFRLGDWSTYPTATVDFDNFIMNSGTVVNTALANDYFTNNDSIIDLEKWELPAQTSHGNVFIQSDNLNLNFTSITGDAEYISLDTRFALFGDFDVQIDVSILSTEMIDASGIELYFRRFLDTNYRGFLKMTVASNVKKFASLYYTNFISQGITYADRANDYGKLRLVRSNSNLIFYYKDGDGDWIELRTATDFTTEPLSFKIGVYNPSNGGAINSVVDSFIVNYAEGISGFIDDTGSIVAQSVWFNNYMGVWNMAQDPSTGNNSILDSTVKENHGTPVGSMTSGDLLNDYIGKGIYFDGSTYIEIPDDDSLDLTDNFTLEALVSVPTDAFGTFRGLLAKGSGYRILNYGLGTESNNRITFGWSDGSYKWVYSNDNALKSDTFSVMTVTIVDSYANLYVDGISVGGGPITELSSNSSVLAIGCDLPGDYEYFKGKSYHNSISKVVRTSAWLKASSYSLKDDLIISDRNSYFDLNKDYYVAVEEGSLSFKQFPSLSFINLIDTPTTYSGFEGKYLISTASGIEFIDAPTGSGISGSSTFIDLTDTPENYSEGKYLISTASGIEFTAISGSSIESFTDISDIPDPSAGKYLRRNLSDDAYEWSTIDVSINDITLGQQWVTNSGISDTGSFYYLEENSGGVYEITNTLNSDSEFSGMIFTIDHTKVDEDLTNFPVLINLSSNSGQTNFDATDVFDILGSYDNRKKLYFEVDDLKCVAEIESWDQENKKAAIWVNIPLISSTTDTEIILWYDTTLPDQDTRTLIADDDFTGNDGDAPDNERWLTTNTANGAASIQSNKLDFSFNTAPISDERITLDGRCALVGDFDIQLDFSNLVLNDSEYTRIILRANSAVTSDYCQIYATYRIYHGENRWQGNASSGWGGQAADTTGVTLTGQFRLIRSGTSLAAQYKADGGNWATLFTASNSTGPVIPAIYFDNRDNSVIPTCEVDNFKVNSGTVVNLAAVNDDFTGSDGSVPNIKKWFSGDSASIQSNSLALIADNVNNTVNIKSNYIISGNFDTQVDFDTGSNTLLPNFGSILEISSTDFKDKVRIYLNYGGTLDYRCSYKINDVWTWAPSGVTTTDRSGKFKCTRVGNVFYSYYWDGSSWQEILIGGVTLPGVSDKGVTISLMGYSNNGTYTFNYDNFIVNYADSISGFTDDTGSAVAQSVWNSGFVGVWHMAQDPIGGTNSIVDSTRYENHGTPAGSMTSGDLIDGPIGKALDFDGSNDNVDFGNDSTLSSDLVSALTIESTLLINEFPSADWSAIIDKGDYSGSWSTRIGANGRLGYTLTSVGGEKSSSSSANLITENEWYNYALIADKESFIDTYLNGVQTTSVTPLSGDFKTTSYSVKLSLSTNPSGRYTNQKLSEVRISKTARSAAWIKATSHTLKDELITSKTFAFTSTEKNYLGTIKSSFTDLTDTPENYSDNKHLISTASGIEFDDNSYYSETEIDSKLTNISGSLQSEIDNISNSVLLADGSVEVSGNLLPDMAVSSGTVSLFNLGSPTQKFNNAYFHDLYVDAGSLYVNNKKIIEDISDTITIKTDDDQDLRIKTTGLGDVILQSDNEINFNSKGGVECVVVDDNSTKHVNFTNQSNGGNITFSSEGINSQVQLYAADEIDITSNFIDINGDLDVSGNLTVNGEPIGSYSNIESFTDLTDTPENYSEGKYLISTASGIEFTAISGSSIESFTDISDIPDPNAGKYLRRNLSDDAYEWSTIDVSINDITLGQQWVTNSGISDIGSFYYLEENSGGVYEITNSLNSDSEFSGMIFTIDHTKVDEDLTNFPVLINLSSDSGTTAFDATDVFDILGSYDNRKKLYFEVDGSKCVAEIESWDQENKKAAIWVNVPLISSTEDTVISLWYDAEFPNQDTRTLIADDNFTGNDGDAPNIEKWDLSVTGANSPFTIQSNMLYGESENGNILAVSNFRIFGDFDIQIDFNLNSVLNEERWALHFDVLGHGRERFYLLREYEAATNKYRILERDALDNYNTVVNSVTSDAVGKLRIVRNSGVISGYFWAESSWSLLGTGSYTWNDTAQITLAIESTSTSAPLTKISYDNFKINSGTVVNLASADDDFTGDNGDAPNVEKWTEDDDNNKLSIQSNALNFSSSDSSDMEARATSKALFSGDFDIEIDFDIITIAQPSTSNHYCRLAMIIGSDEVRIARSRSNSQNSYIRYGTSTSWNEVATSDTSGKLRVTRSGSVIKSYTWNGSAWENEFTYTETATGSAKVELWFKQESNAELNVSVDNFKVNYAESISGFIDDTGSLVAQSVWDNDFIGVWHMAQDPTGGTDCILDSTLNENHGTPAGTMTTGDLIDGPTGKALDFDGTDDYISMDHNDNLSLTDNFSIEIFEKLPIDFTFMWRSALCKGTSNYNVNYSAGVRVDAVSSFSWYNEGYHWADSAIDVLTEDVYDYMAHIITSNQATIYVNDNIPVSNSISALSTNTEPLTIGVDLPGGDEFFIGSIAEVRISKIARSAAWIKATNYTLKDDFIASKVFSSISTEKNYLGTIKSSFTDLTDTPENYSEGKYLISTASGIEFTAISGSSIESFTDISDIPDPSAGKYLRRNLSDDAYEWIDGIVPDGRQKSVIILSEDIVKYESWNITLDNIDYEYIPEFISAPGAPLAEYLVTGTTGSVLVDSSNNNNDATLVNSPDIVDGYIEKAIKFTGTEYINCGALGTITDRSISFWVNFDTFVFTGSNANTLFAFNTDIGGNTDIIRVSSDGYLASYDAATIKVQCTKQLDLNTWYHVVIIVNGSTTYYYINGELHGSGSWSPSINSTDILYIGMEIDGTNPSDYMHGYISNFKVYDQAISTDYISQLYNEGKLKILISVNAENYASEINSENYVAISVDNRIYITSVESTTYTLIGNDYVITELFPREFSLESLTEVPEPTPGQFMRRKSDDSGYEWSDPILIAQLRTGILTLLDGSVDDLGNPVDKFGAFTPEKVGALTTFIETEGVLDGRQVFILNGTDAAIKYAADEELRICGDMTIAFWTNLDLNTDLNSNDYPIISCYGSGESVYDNYLYLIKHNEDNAGKLWFFHENGSGSNNIGSKFIDVTSKDKWYFVVASRTNGIQWDVSYYSDNIWAHDYTIMPNTPQKSTIDNTQILHLFSETGYYKGKCAGIGIWNRAMSRYERMMLKDVFFSL